MYSPQRGFLPFITSLVALLIFIVSGVTSVRFGYIAWINALDTAESTSEMILLAAQIISAILFLALPLPILIAMFLSGMFPEIKISQNGLGYRSLLRQGILRWDEIEAITSFGGDYKALLINRRGFSIMNGLYLNSLYGQMINRDLPVLFLSPGLQNRNEVIRIVGEKTTAKDLS